MPDSLNESLAIIYKIQAHFVLMGWQPLLQVKVNGLHTLSHETLQRLLPKVLAATDRLDAVEYILAAIVPGNELQPEAKPELPDSAVLRLRSDDQR